MWFVKDLVHFQISTDDHKPDPPARAICSLYTKKRFTLANKTGICAECISACLSVSLLTGFTEGTTPEKCPRNVHVLPSVKLRWLLTKSSSSVCQAVTAMRLEVQTFYFIFFRVLMHKVPSVITAGFIDQHSLHIPICQGKGGAPRLKDSIRELRAGGRIHASLETPAALMYIQENRKKVTILLKICQVAFNHGAAGHFARGERSSGGRLSCNPLERCPFGAKCAESSSTDSYSRTNE